MSQMIYRSGKMAKWNGIGYDWKIIKPEDIEAHLKDGWLDHPDKLSEPEQKKKPGPKPKKANSDESDNEG